MEWGGSSRGTPQRATVGDDSAGLERSSDGNAGGAGDEEEGL